MFVGIGGSEAHGIVFGAGRKGHALQADPGGYSAEDDGGMQEPASGSALTGCDCRLLIATDPIVIVTSTRTARKVFKGLLRCCPALAQITSECILVKPRPLRGTCTGRCSANSPRPLSQDSQRNVTLLIPSADLGLRNTGEWSQS